MGRYGNRKPVGVSRGAPAGPRWQEYIRLLWRQWGPGVPCFYCRHPIGPGGGEVAHLISKVIAPELAWSRSNLAPSHSKGNMRCPACDCACNLVASIAPDAPFEMIELNGRMVRRDLPFTDQFMARERSRNSGRKPPIPPRFRGEPPEPRRPSVPFRESPGRDW